MRKLKSLALAAISALMLVSCSDDSVNPDEGGSVKYPVGKDGAYFALTIDLPSADRYGSRSETGDPDANGSTSNTGVEIGQDYENKVNEVIIVLAHAPKNPTSTDPVNGFIAAATVQSDEIKSVDPTNNTSYQVTSTFTMTQLNNFYSAVGENMSDFNCNIFVFANPGTAIKNIIFGDENLSAGPDVLSTDWINAIVNLTQSPENNIANKEKGFLMMNALIATRNIPSNINDWRHYTSISNPFDLSGDNSEVDIDNGGEGRGAIKLERAAARFDFRDGSPLGNFSYHVVRDGDPNDPNAEALIDIQLTNMSLVNVNKAFYALPRVSPTGKPVDVTICGSEKRWYIKEDGGYERGNYVVDANEAWKTLTANLFDGDQAPANVDYAGHFFFPLFTAEGAINNANGAKNWYTSKCAEVIKGTNDNPQSWNQSGESSQYHIWTYATENTIAGYENQKNGISTGVVFKGKMIATTYAKESKDPSVKALADAITNAGPNSPYLYSFGGNLYVGWKGIRDAAINAAVSGIEWVPDSESDINKGHFEFKAIDRKNILYVAVFGNGGIGTVEFTYTQYKFDEDGKKVPEVDADENVIQYTGTLTDELPVASNSADAYWTKYEQSTSSTNLSAFKKAATDAKITIYQTSNDNGDGYGYYCYYYYWNRHNNLGETGIMNPMEFAVVRNNVYKLAVTDIKQLGHPRLTENDPDRPTGGTDDEVQQIYISVTAEVLPWVVRVNNIEF